MPKGNPHPGNQQHLRRGGQPGRAVGSKNKLTREMVERELRWIATSDIIQLFEGIHGNRRNFSLREVKAMPIDIRRCIASVKIRTENLTAGDGSQDTTVEVRLWDKTKALELCARTLGMLKDKVEITAPDELIARLDRAKMRALATKKESVE